MILVIIVLFLIFLLLGILTRYRVENYKYKLLSNLVTVDRVKVKDKIMDIDMDMDMDTNERGGISLKYNRNTDYSTFHQRRAKGQIRDTGDTN